MSRQSDQQSAPQVDQSSEADVPPRADDATELSQWILGEGSEPTGKASYIVGVAIGVLAQLGENGPMVDFVDNPRSRPIVARATLQLTMTDLGREVALMFEAGDPSRPIVMGLLHQPSLQLAPESTVRSLAHAPDPERMVFTAAKEIVFRCGKSSITLTRAGKVLIRGAYLLNDSSGLNRIRGGTVEIN